MGKRGLPERIVSSNFTEASGHLAASDLLLELLTERDDPAEVTGPTGPSCVNDHCAIGALQSVIRAGVRVPEDVSVIGFDDSSAAALPFVRLTSVRSDPDRMAQLAIEAVHERLERPGAAPAASRVTPTLTLRDSTARPAR